MLEDQSTHFYPGWNPEAILWMRQEMGHHITTGQWRMAVFKTHVPPSHCLPLRRLHPHCLPLKNSLKNTCYLALGSIPQAIRPS